MPEPIREVFATTTVKEGMHWELHFLHENAQRKCDESKGALTVTRLPIRTDADAAVIAAATHAHDDLDRLAQSEAFYGGQYPDSVLALLAAVRARCAERGA